jgi:hypothetical protein
MSHNTKVNICFITITLALFIGALVGERGGIKIGYEKAFDEPGIQKKEFLRCFYDTVKRARPYLAEWDLCNPELERA